MTIKVRRKGEGLLVGEANHEDEETRVQLFAKQMLVARVFAASYIGRFYVESLNKYRDVIKINEEESELIRDLQIVKRRIQDSYKGSVWAAITGPADSMMDENLSGHCLWVRLENLAFGHYWFITENVTFCNSGEVIIEVKVVRNFEPSVAKTGKHEESSFNFDEIKNSLLSTVLEVITWQNVKESTKFLFLLSMTIITTILYALQYLGDYSIRFFREFNNLIHVCTPILHHILELISKAIGGFYILLAMMWRSWNQPLPPAYPSIKAVPLPPRAIKPLYNRRQHL